MRRVELTRSKTLEQAWNAADGAMASGWRLMGVVCGPREIDPKIRSAGEWCAWARGPDKERLEGRGTAPLDALLQLTVKLKELGE